MIFVVGAIGLILFNNRTHTVHVWLFGLTNPDVPVNVIWVMLATALCTLAAWWLVSLGRGLIHDIRTVQRDSAAAAERNAAEQRVAELDARQRRVEEQLRKATAGDGRDSSNVDM